MQPLLTYARFCEQRPLIFCALLGLEEEGLDLLKRKGQAATVNDADHRDYTALHHASNLGLNALARALISAKAEVAARTDMISCGVFVPGGLTPLHLAASHGDPTVVETLLDAKADPAARDWEGAVPLELARNRQVVELLRGAAMKLWGERAPPQTVNPLEPKIQADRGVARARRTRLARDARLDIRKRPELHTPHLVEKLWSTKTCDWLLCEAKKVVKVKGWTSQRHQKYPTTDIPAHDVPAVYPWVRRSFKETVFPKMAGLFRLDARALRLRDVFFVKYAAMDSAQRGLEFHRDGSLMSCNVLLNDSTEFKGGGTTFRESSRGPCVVSGGKGDFLMHTGQLLHGGQDVTWGVRYILVAFIDVKVPHKSSGDISLRRAAGGGDAESEP